MSGFVSAQKVLYSPIVGMEGATRFEVAGKAGDNYWVQKSRIHYSRRKNGEPWSGDRQLQFDIYDARMNFLRSLPASIPPSLVKEYLVPADNSFDQLMITSQQDSSYVVLKRFSTGGDTVAGRDTLVTLPIKTRTGDYLLVRSPGRNTLVLLVFIPMGGLHPAIQAYRFDNKWNLESTTTYTERRLTKPLVQYDLVDYPLESYSSAPIKIDDAGNCWMLTSCGINHNYIVTCLRPGVEGVDYREVKLPSNLEVEDAAMSIDTATGTGFAGVVARESHSTTKAIRVIRFQVESLNIQLDTVYYASTNGGKSEPDHLYEEYFMIIPSKGFLLLKESGRKLQPDEAARGDRDDEPAGGDFTDESFTRFDNLAGGEG
ncbi:MAG TPA: hypothetical protein VGC95_06565, partial [Chitinophagaceae bacterium]